MLICAASTTQTVTIITTVTIVLILGALLSISKKKIDTKMLSYAAVCLAISFTLSFVKFFEMPYGGSITLASLLPIILFAYMYGPRSGLLVGVIYALLQFMQEPYFLTPVQFLLDYILAFMSVGVAGFFGLFIKNNKLGLTIAVPVVYTVRGIFHILAGYVFFSSVTDRASEIPIFGDTSAMSGFYYSFIYNATFIIPETIIAVVIIVLISKRKSFMDYVSNTFENNKDQALVEKIREKFTKEQLDNQINK